MVVRSRSRSGSSSSRRRRRRTTTIVPSPRAPYCRKKPRLPLQKTPSMRYRRKKPRLPSQKTPTNACHLSIPRKKPSPHRRKKHPCGQYCHRKPFLRSPSQKNPLTPHRCKKNPKLSQKTRSPTEWIWSDLQCWLSVKWSCTTMTQHVQHGSNKTTAIQHSSTLSKKHITRLSHIHSLECNAGGCWKMLR